MSREVANLIRENSELLQTKHALNVLKDDLIVRLDNFSSEMVLLREELKSLQTIKACLQLRISELEEEAKKYKEDLAEKTKKQEEEDVSLKTSEISFNNMCRSRLLFCYIIFLPHTANKSFACFNLTN